MKLVLATNNNNKLREFKEILTPLGYTVISQSEAGVNIEVDENGKTFEDNAFLKADAIYKITALPVISDDSGLEVDYLNGEPGVYSARYAEPGKECQKVLDKLSGVPEEKRGARFVCAICYIDNHGKVNTFRGECEGKIGYEKRGEFGFGYDPIFMVGEKSFSEMTPDEKNSVSHRANAVKKLLDIMKGNN